MPAIERLRCSHGRVVRTSERGTVRVERHDYQRNERERAAEEHDLADRDVPGELDRYVHQRKGEGGGELQRDAAGRMAHGLYSQPRLLNQRYGTTAETTISSSEMK